MSNRDVVMEKLHVIGTVRGGTARQTKRLQTVARLRVRKEFLERVVLCQCWILADNYVQVNTMHLGSVTYINLHPRLRQLEHAGRASWHFIFRFLHSIQPCLLFVWPRR